MIMKKTVGEKIRSFRQQKKLTQEQLALGAEINPVFLGHLERNLKSPNNYNIRENNKSSRNYYVWIVLRCA